MQPVLSSLAEISPVCPVIRDIAPQVEAGVMVRVDDACRAARVQSINVSARATPSDEASRQRATKSGRLATP